MDVYLWVITEQLAVGWIRKLPSPLLQQQYVVTSCSYIFKFKSLSTETADIPFPCPLRKHGYTECPRRNLPDFGRVFLMLNCTDITQNTYIRSWTVTEIMAREKCGLLAGSMYCTCSAGWHVTRISHVLESGTQSVSRRCECVIGVSRMEVWRTLHEEDLYPYHDKMVHLEPGDHAQHMDLCHWMTAHPELLSVILFTDEASLPRTV